MNPWLLQIIAEGTGKTFSLEMNAAWEKHTRPILEAFFHARFFIEMVIRNPLPSGWAAVLCLYRLG